MAITKKQQRRRWASAGGKIGGPRRALSLSPKRRQEIARLAANARWANGKALKA